MNRIEELRKVAEAATQKPWKKVDDMSIGTTDIDIADVFNSLDQDFIVAANPQTILALLDLIELQHEALIDCKGVVRYFQSSYGELYGMALYRAYTKGRIAIEAYNKFKEQS